MFGNNFGLGKMIEQMGEQMGDLVPSKRKIVDYKIVVNSNVSEFNNKCESLVISGYEPHGFLQCCLTSGGLYFTKEFIKYKSEEDEEEKRNS